MVGLTHASLGVSLWVGLCWLAAKSEVLGVPCAKLFGRIGRAKNKQSDDVFFFLFPRYVEFILGGG